MSLVLTIEHGPRAQAMSQARLDGGEMVIGRSPEADWQIDDPDKFISRAHCKIVAEGDNYVITDTSTSGLFIDQAGQPLGAGNSARLRSGMRLRLGDYVVWVEVRAAGAAAEQARPRTALANGAASASDDFFSARREEEPVQPRPSDLPSPFEFPEPASFRPREGAEGNISPAFDDPFSLDPVATPKADDRWSNQREVSRDADSLSFGSAPSQPEASPAQNTASFADDFSFEPVAPRVERADPVEKRQETRDHPAKPAPWEMPPEHAAQPARRTPSVDKPSSPTPRAAPSDALDLRAAFLRGLELEETGQSSADPVAEMERFGREYRLMMEGLMQLLRMRAEEKVNARVAQTIVGASEVNPLKFLPTVDDAITMITSSRSPGFLPGERAIADAVRDLAQHHVRAWRGVQEALRRMIDRFDPVSLEEELKSGSSIETLLAGGRGAKLWELYRKRHREIAMNAESRFLGEIGADFRDAYEGEE